MSLNPPILPNSEPSPPMTSPPPITRSNRPSRACTLRTAQRLLAAAQQQKQQATSDKKIRVNKKQQKQQLEEEDCNDDNNNNEEDELLLLQCIGGSNSSKVVTALVVPPSSPLQLPRWNLRSMWELASVLNFFNVFRELLNVNVEFTVEEFETALITPNDTLADIHMPLLKAIPPVTRMALTRDTWVTVLCRKLRDWWHWVADGDLPIVASQGLEIEAYKTLDPGVRVVILKALCDIRVEQEDIRNYIDNSIKHGVQVKTFRKERVGGDSYGINYWYEDDPVIGHRLYREIRKVEVKKARKGSQVISNTSYQWETVATNLEEFQDVSEKLFSSKNRAEVSIGKKLKNDMLPEIEKEHKRREKLLRKQQRQALLLDSYSSADGFAAGRSLRDRKPVTYTFDDYDRSISEAIKITKNKPSPEPVNVHRRDGTVKPEASANGKWSGPSSDSHDMTFSALSPKLSDSDDDDLDERKPESLDRSNRRRQRSLRYSAKDYIEEISDNDAESDSDDEIVGEAVYDDEYMRKRKKQKSYSSSEADEEEYSWNDENAEEEEAEEEEEDLSSLSGDDDSDGPHHRVSKKLRGRTRRETKLKSVDELQFGLRRSRRATRNRINYRQYELSESENEKPNGFDEQQTDDGSDQRLESSFQSEDEEDETERKVDPSPPVEGDMETTQKEKNQTPEKPNNSPGEDEEEVEGVHKRRFLDLNELAPGSGFDDSPNSVVKNDGTDNL
ncbi:hypothetical protein ACFE04_027328 [Oxalis oulophora]